MLTPKVIEVSRGSAHLTVPKPSHGTPVCSDELAARRNKRLATEPRPRLVAA